MFSWPNFQIGLKCSINLEIYSDALQLAYTTLNEAICFNKQMKQNK